MIWKPVHYQGWNCETRPQPSILFVDLDCHYQGWNCEIRPQLKPLVSEKYLSYFLSFASRKSLEFKQFIHESVKKTTFDI